MSDFIEAIRARQRKKTEFGYGILTADLYLKQLIDAIGIDLCWGMTSRGNVSFDDLMRKAASVAVYSSPEMVVEEKARDSYGSLPKGIELPKNTLMVFRHVLTTSTEDRDGDKLHSEGASIDPKMLLLWQHIHTMPIGKFLAVSDQNKHWLKVWSALVDINELCHDAAVMIDNGMGRFSHGFRALEFTEVKEANGAPRGGFEIHRFEIMEESLVTVPANPDAQTEEVVLSLVDGGKLKSAPMTEFAKTIRQRRPLMVPVTLDLKVTMNGVEVKDANMSRSRGEAGAGEGTGGTTEKRASGAPTEEDGAAAGAKAAETADQKVIVEGSVPLTGSMSTLPGSWEMITATLAMDVRRFLLANNANLGENEWTWIIGTYPSYVIVCAERTGGSREYYRIKWTLQESKPVFTGTPEQIELRVHAELLEMSKQAAMLMDRADYRPPEGKPYPGEHAARLADPGKFERFRRQNNKFGEGVHAIWGITDDGKVVLQAIRFDSSKFDEDEAKKWLEEHDYEPIRFEPAVEETKKGAKYGRVISKANEGLIKEALDDVEEAYKMEIPRPCKALLKSAKLSLKQVLDAIGEEGPMEEKPQYGGEASVQEAIAKVISDASPEERKQLIRNLQAIEAIENDKMLSRRLQLMSTTHHGGRDG